MKKEWQRKGIAFTFIFLCLVTTALFEWHNCTIVSSSRIDPTFDYASSILPDTTASSVNRINRIKYGKNNSGSTPIFETIPLSRILHFSPDYHCSHTSGVRFISGIDRKSFDRFCQLDDIPPPSITA